MLCPQMKICIDVMKGYNGTIFAYGQTGSGKVSPLKNEFKDIFYIGCNVFVFCFRRIP